MIVAQVETPTNMFTSGLWGNGGGPCATTPHTLSVVLVRQLFVGVRAKHSPRKRDLRGNNPASKFKKKHTKRGTIIDRPWLETCCLFEVYLRPGYVLSNAVSRLSAYCAGKAETMKTKKLKKDQKYTTN